MNYLKEVKEYCKKYNLKLDGMNYPLNKELQKIVNDKRYFLTHEYIGYYNKRYVLRFDGGFVSSNMEKKDTLLDAIFHQDERNFNILSL